MKTINVRCSDEHNRTLIFSNLPAYQGSGYTLERDELTVALRYTEQPNDGSRVEKAICLDNVVIPAILRAFDSQSELIVALNRTLDALFNETASKEDSPWISDTKALAIAAIAKATGDIQ